MSRPRKREILAGFEGVVRALSDAALDGYCEGVQPDGSRALPEVQERARVERRRRVVERARTARSGILPDVNK